MSHLPILKLLLSIPGVQVFRTEDDIGIIYRIESEKLVAYRYNQAREVWIKRTMVNPLHIFSGKYASYTVGKHIEGEVEPVNEPSQFMLEITDKQVIQDLIDYKPVKIPLDNGVGFACLDRQTNVISFFNEEQYKLQELLDYAGNQNKSVNTYISVFNVKNLLQGKTVFTVTKYGYKTEGEAYQFEGDHLVKYKINRELKPWNPVECDIYELFDRGHSANKIIDRIIIPNDAPKNRQYSLTDKQILEEYLKTNTLYFKFADGLTRIKNGRVDNYDGFLSGTSDIVEVTSDINLGDLSEYEKLQYRLRFEQRIDIFDTPEKTFKEALEYLFNNNKDNRIRFIFCHYHGIISYEKLTKAEISRRLGISSTRVDQILRHFHYRLRHPSSKDIFKQGYINKPGDLTAEYVEEPTKPQNLSIDRMHYYAGCIAEIY